MAKTRDPIEATVLDSEFTASDIVIMFPMLKPTVLSTSRTSSVSVGSETKTEDVLVNGGRTRY